MPAPRIAPASETPSRKEREQREEFEELLRRAASTLGSAEQPSRQPSAGNNRSLEYAKAQPIGAP